MKPIGEKKLKQLEEHILSAVWKYGIHASDCPNAGWKYGDKDFCFRSCHVARLDDQVEELFATMRAR